MPHIILIMPILSMMDEQIQFYAQVVDTELRPDPSSKLISKAQKY